MTDSRPTPPSDEAASSSEAATPVPAGDTTAESESSSSPTSATPVAKPQDPLRGSATSGIWLAVVAFALLLVLLAVFILQNTGSVEISFLGWTGSAPLAAMLLIAAAGGALLVVMAGSLRILQLRRRVRRDRKSQARVGSAG